MGQKTIVSPPTEPSVVETLLSALSSFEDDLSALDGQVVDMKQNLKNKSQQKITEIMEKTRQLATQEAESIIQNAKSSAKEESQKILDDGENKLAEIKSKIDTSFDDAVQHTVDMIMQNTPSQD